MKYLVGRSLLNPPYLEIVEVQNDVPGITLNMVPPLFATAEKLRFPRDNSQMMVATKFRREFVQGIGSPSEVVPAEGLRLIAPNDAYVVFGGSATIDPVLYQRRGPGYERWSIEVPEGEHITAAAFSASSRHLFVVTSDDDSEVKVLRRGSTGFVQIHAIATAFVVVDVSVSPGDGYVIIEGASVFVAHQNLDQGSNPYPAVPTTPVGKLMAISPDNRWYVMDMEGDAENLDVYEHSVGTWTHLLGLTGTDGAGRKAAFSPDGRVLQISMTDSATRHCPAFFNVGDGDFQFTRGRLRANSATREHRGAVFSRDSAYMMQTHTDDSGSTSIVELYEQAPYLPEIFEVADPLPLDDVPAMAQVQGMAFSADGTYFAYCGNASPYLAVYKNDGSGNFDRLTTLSENPANVVHGVTFSPNGDYLVVCQAVAPSVLIYKRSGDNWNLLSSPLNALPNGPYKAKFSEDSNWLVFALNGTLNIAAYKRTDDSFSNVGVTLNGGTAVSGTNFPSFDMNADGTACVIGGQRAAGNGTHWAIWRRTGDTWTRVTRSSNASNIKTPAVAIANDGEIVIIGTMTASDTGGAVAMLMWNSGTSSYDLVNTLDHFNESLAVGQISAAFFNADSTLLFLVGSYSGENMRVYQRVDDQFVRQEGTEDTAERSNTSGFDSNVMSPDGRYIASGGSTSTLQLLTEVLPDPENPVLTYTFVRSVSVSAEFPELWGFNPDGSVAHFGGSVGHHRATDDFDVTPSQLSFDSEYAPSSITRVLWSRSGNFVLYDNPDGPSVSVKTSGSDDFTMAKNLNGLFVSKYVRQEDEMVETEYVMHNIDAVLTNPTYSATGLALSYFLMDEPGTTGRYIYDSADEKLDLKGIDYDPRMEASYLGFSPHETHFAVTYRMSDSAHEIRLFSFGSNRVYNLHDTALTPFGPVDISTCDDVLVANGGLVNPFTLFSIEDMELVQEDFPITDWDRGGFIFDVLWFEDCSGFYGVLPDEIIVIDNEGEDDKIIDSVPIEPPIDEDDDTEIDYIDDEEDEEDRRIRVDYEGDDDGGGGVYRPTPGGPIIDVTYLNYSTVHVTYRR